MLTIIVGLIIIVIYVFLEVIKQTIYIVFILLSFIYGILEFIKCKQ